MAMSKKRIVIFGYSGSIHVKKWALSLQQRGYSIRVISLDGDEIPGVEVIRLHRKGKLSYFLQAKDAVQKALEFQPEIIHVHYVGGYGIWGVKTKFHPMLVSVWGSDIESLPKSIFYRPFIKSALTKADLITATSESLKKSTLALDNTLKNKIEIVPFGVHIPESYIEISDKNYCSAIYLKHLHSVYAPEILIEATAIVIENFPSFKLTLCGDGPLKESLIELSNSLNLQKHIQFVGQIENRKVPELIQQHGFMVMPSLKEGFGVAAVEAFACGRPVVATNVGGIPEIVTDSINGYLVQPNNIQELADAMIKLISDKNRMIEFGKNGYESVRKRYDWERCVDKMEKVYNSL